MVFTIASGLVERDVRLLELVFGSLSEVKATPTASCVVAWLVTLARMAELSCAPLMSPVVRLAMRTAPTRRYPARHQVGDGVLHAAHLGAFAVRDGGDGDHPNGDGDDCGARAGARRRPRR